MPFTDSLEFVEVVRADKYQITATPSDVALGKVFIGSTRQLETGNLPVLPEHSDVVLLAGEQITIEYGKNPKAFVVRSAAMGDQTPATATPPDIKEGETAWVNGIEITGTMPIIEDHETTLLAGEEYTPALGWHSGASLIKAETLAKQTQANAGPEHILQEYGAWVNGQYVEGAMTNNAPVTITLSAGERYQVPEGFHNGEDIIIAPSLESTSPGTALSEDIKDGKVAWVNGVEIIGSMPIIAPSAHALPFNGTFYISKGYHDGNGYVTQNIPAIEDQIVISPAFEDQTISAAGKYMVQDILVNGIDALNYRRPSTEYIINDENLGADIKEKEYKLSVDNWHDNATLNVYYFEYCNHDSSAGNAGEDGVTTAYANGILFIDWKNAQSSTYNYYFKDGTTSITVSLSLEVDTNAHTFKFEVPNLTSGYVTDYFRVRELFHARQFGDDHDVDTP